MAAGDGGPGSATTTGASHTGALTSDYTAAESAGADPRVDPSARDSGSGIFLGFKGSLSKLWAPFAERQRRLTASDTANARPSRHSSPQRTGPRTAARVRFREPLDDGGASGAAPGDDPQRDARSSKRDHPGSGGIMAPGGHRAPLERGTGLGAAAGGRKQRSRRRARSPTDASAEPPQLNDDGHGPLRWAPRALFALLATTCAAFPQGAASSWNGLTNKGRCDFAELCTPQRGGLGEEIVRRNGTAFRLPMRRTRFA